MAKQRLNSPQMNPSKTTDANGWTVLDMGSFKICTKLVTTSLSGFNGAAFITGLATSLPVSVPTFSVAITASANFFYGNSGALRCTNESTGTNTTFNIVGQTTSTYTGTVSAYYMVIG